MAGATAGRLAQEIIKKSCRTVQYVDLACSDYSDSDKKAAKIAAFLRSAERASGLALVMIRDDPGDTGGELTGIGNV